MLTEILLAIIQAVTEFFPISSSGHLALISNLISKPDLFFFTALHLSSLIAVLIFTRKEISNLLSFKKEYRKIWLYLIIATIPAGIVGFFLENIVESSLSSFLFLGIAFIFTGVVLFLTKFTKVYSKLNWKNSLFIGLFQAVSVFPGVSRSGMTISSSMFSGIEKEKAAKFSFLLFIPLSLGAFILELKNFYFSFSLLISFFVCLILSLIFLNLLVLIIRKNYFWLFSLYCLILGIISLILYFR
ncbi:undecaprenyl-diphosphate phosphatase [Candidatus Pacearchaeota archaeon]|nr:undecaprenyl-diphosphate phosphatase [Candidatus Pacearchaeota archaeon]